MSKTKKVFKIKLLIITYGLALVVSVIAPNGNSTIPSVVPTPAVAHEAQVLPAQPPVQPDPAPLITPPPATATEKPGPKKSPVTKNGRINYPYYALATPNDPHSVNSWAHGTTSLRPAWDIATGSAATIIAVIDTGFALSHQDLASRYWTNTAESGTTTTEASAPNCTSRGLALNKQCDNLDNDNNGYIDDYRGWDFENGDNNPDAGSTNSAHSSASHGTAVAGIIGATANNSMGIAGVNWNARIMPLQGLADDGAGYTDSIADAVRYAADNGAQIINLSLGSEYNDSYLKSALDYAQSKNVSIVAAAGNDGCDCLLYPARYPEIISVGASTSSDTRASFSSYGANLDLVAPGTNICSTHWVNTNQTSSYSCVLQGTSFAAPYVAGAISLLISKRPGLAPDQIEKYLKDSSIRVSSMNGSFFATTYGYGRLNFSRLLGSATIPQPIATPFTPTASTVSLGSTGSLSNLCQSRGPSCNIELTSSNGLTIQASSTSSPSSLVASGLTTGSWTVLPIDSTTGRSIDPGINLTITP